MLKIYEIEKLGMYTVEIPKYNLAYVEHHIDIDDKEIDIIAGLSNSEAEVLENIVKRHKRLIGFAQELKELNGIGKEGASEKASLNASMNVLEYNTICYGNIVYRVHKS